MRVIKQSVGGWSLFGEDAAGCAGWVSVEGKGEIWFARDRAR